jgi:histone acetyltransferase
MQLSDADLTYIVSSRECYIHPSIDFTRIEEMVETQRKFILDRIALTAKSATVVYPPVRKLHVEESPLSRSNPSIARALSIPGVAEAGWTVADLMPDASTGREGSLSAAALKTELLDAIRKISEQQYAWPFREPVNVEEVPDYLEIIKNPIDLKTMERKAKQDTYKSKQMLFNDVMLMCDNCRVFNEDGSQYTQCANKVERYTRNLLPECTRKTPKK